jgi:hypothetical protein
MLAISNRAPFNHSIPLTAELEADWAGSPSDLVAENGQTVPRATVSLADDGQSLRIVSDASGLTNLFASPAIPVRQSTDYVLAVPITFENGLVNLDIIDADRRVTLTSTILRAEGEGGRRRRNSAKETAPESAGTPVARMIQIPFTSAGHSQVRLLASGAAEPPARLVVELGIPKTFAIGSTPYAWTRYPRGLVRGIQRNVFSTVCMISLIAIGIALLLLAGRFRALLILLWIPLYYVGSHVPFRTHYRYTLPVHYFLFVIASVAIYFAGLVLLRTAQRLRPRTAAQV